MLGTGRNWELRTMTQTKTEDVLRILHQCKARLTGSYARREESDYSDLDFYLPEQSWSKFIGLAKAQLPAFESCIVGHVAWYTYPAGLVEVSYIFRRQKLVDKERWLVIGDGPAYTWQTW